MKISLISFHFLYAKPSDDLTLNLFYSCSDIIFYVAFLILSKKEEASLFCECQKDGPNDLVGILFCRLCLKV
jgi:hypothetical protein